MISRGMNETGANNIKIIYMELLIIYKRKPYKIYINGKVL